MRPVGGKQGLASAARAEAVAAASFAKAASSFAASPTNFFTFSWDGVETSTTTGSTSSDQQAGPREKAESSNKFRVDHWKSLSSDVRVGGGGGPRIRLIATAARLLNREMMKHGQVVTIDKIEELLLVPIDAGSPQLRALLPHLVTIAHKLPLPDEVRPDLGLPAQPPAIPKVLLPSDFYAAPPPAAPVVHQIIQVQPPAESTQKLNWASFVYGAVVSYAVTLGMDKALEQMKEYRPDFTQLGHPSMDETPEPQCTGKSFD